LKITITAIIDDFDGEEFAKILAQILGLPWTHIEITLVIERSVEVEFKIYGTPGNN
jgi:hypothetical protein